MLDTFSFEMMSCAEQFASETPFDVIIASEVDMAEDALRLPARRRVLEDLELSGLHDTYASERRLLPRLRTGLTWWKAARYAAGLVRAMDAVTVVSEAERALAQRLAPGTGALTIIPNGVDIAHHSGDFGAPEPETLVYSGALTYHANFDAMAYFLREIWPRVRTERPTARLTITGHVDGVPIDRLPRDPNVTFTGYLDDIRPAVARSWASLAPLRKGGGTRVKILESLALGTPVVATTKGAEGLALRPGEDLLIADEPGAFAEAVLCLLGSPALRASLSQHGRQRVAAQYDWAAIGEAFCELVAQIARREQVPT